MKGREEPLSVRGAYPLTWREYSSVTGQHQYGLFRYLSVRVDRETIGGVGAEQDSQAQPVAE